MQYIEQTIRRTVELFHNNNRMERNVNDILTHTVYTYIQHSILWRPLATLQCVKVVFVGGWVGVCALCCYVTQFHHVLSYVQSALKLR